MAELDFYRQFLEAHQKYRYRLEQNTFVVESLGLMYMDTPKTAGTSLKTKLAKFEPDYQQKEDSFSLETMPEMFIHDRALNPLPPITHYSIAEQQEILFSDKWKRICVVRNPYDRIFSAWFSKLLLRQPGYMEVVPGYGLPEKIASCDEIYHHFEKFILYLIDHGCDSDPHWDLQNSLLFLDAIEWGRIFKFENLQEQLLADTEYFGGNTLKLEKLNVSGFSPDWGSVSERTIELVQEIYRTDFDVYGYSLSPPACRSEVDILITYINAVAGRNIRLGKLMDLREKSITQIDFAQGEIHTLRGTLQDLELELTKSSVALHELTNSRSWKLTRPLRLMLNFMKETFRRAL